MRLNHLATVVSLVTFTHAWPWPHLFAGDSVEGVNMVYKRQNGGTSPTATQTAASSNNQISTAPTATTDSPTTTARLVSANGGNKPITGSKGNSTATEFDLRDPAGGISMITPAATASAQYYKVGDWIHFAWNYTSLQATPSAINVVATCSQNQATYTLAVNQSVQPTGEIYWDTGAYQASASVPLLTNMYTLIVWDAAQPISATPKAGYLGSYAQFTFGMYTPQPYVDWSQFQITCPTCNGAASLERMTMTALLGMASITVLTFTWFVTNLSVL